MDTLVVDKTNSTRLEARVFTKVKADASGKVPDVIEMIPAGLWPNSWKGSLEITSQDLQEYVGNFNTGVGLPDNGSEGAPVDYSHMDHQKASGWIKKVFINDAGDMLMAQVEWTAAAIQAIKDGEFKFISPSFYPRCLGHWQDPENPERTAVNVLLGAGLTNIPFFKGMKGLKASRHDGGGQGHSLFISASQERNTMTKTLEEILKTPVSEVANLSDEDRAVLTDNKDQLSAEHQILFGLEKPADKPVETPPSPTDVLNNTPTNEDTLTPEAQAVQASIKAGTHKLIATTEITSMQASIKAQGETIKKYERERIDASVAEAVARGAIKADQSAAWGDKIEADASMADILSNLPDNKILASEIGSTEGHESDPVVQMDAKVREAIQASVVDGKEMLEYGEAVTKVRTENADLAAAYDKAIQK